ncbi:DUF1877 family protein [Actinoplanes sp. Pm04-4]|uniref:DUF1877 family protein n=1 Tax=Paractinoplanes pyxinae TaxID=2997416 RepID=A0ABT4BDU9_9ACTN|nr:DUF1877 family protein [Actinoplanes pyxinae]MCY1143995.1 DUF1877 family protein [Actinoplanes pyxinae]
MGLDMSCLIVPLDAEPVRAIRADMALFSTAEEYPPFGPRFGDEVLPDISYQLLEVVSAQCRWTEVLGGRSFAKAEYLLNPASYRAIHTWEKRERSPAYRMTRGDEPFAREGVTLERCSWRCSRSASLKRTAHTIDALDVAAVRREFSVADMCEQGVYKADHPDEDDEENFTEILGYLRDFANLCHQVSGQGLDLVFRLD